MSTTTAAAATTPLTAAHTGSSARPAALRLVISALVALLVAVLIALTGVAPANAYTVTSRSNVPVSPTVYKVQGAHYDVGTPVTGPMWKPWIYQAGPVVYRTAVSGDQYVQVTYSVDRWNGSTWVSQGTQAKGLKITAALTSAQAPALSMLPSAGSGYYRVRLSIVYTTLIGAVSGSMDVAMNTSGDYTCSTSRTCSVASNSVYLGA